MEFNHNKESLTEALGISEKHLLEITEKLSTIAMEVSTSDNLKPSHIAEKIAHELSYTELIFVATQYLTDKITEFQEARKDVIMAALKKILKDLED